MLAAAVAVYGPPGLALTIALGWPTSRVVHWMTTSLRIGTKQFVHHPGPKSCICSVVHQIGVPAQRGPPNIASLPKFQEVPSPHSHVQRSSWLRYGIKFVLSQRPQCIKDMSGHFRSQTSSSGQISGGQRGAPWGGGV